MIHISDKQKQQLSQHPDFAKEFDKASKAITVDADLIPEGLHEYILRLLKNISFASLGMDYATYYELYTLDGAKMEWGLLHKACNMILSSTPGALSCDLEEYVQNVAECTTCVDYITKQVNEVQQKVIQTLWRREKLAGKV